MGRRLVALLLLFLPGFAQKVRVVAASDLQYALPEVARAFERENPGVKVELVFGSSGKLYAQLTQGPEADLFFSADKAYPELLEQRGLAEPGTRKPYALGRVVLWVDRKLGLKPGPEALKDPRVTQLALANPVHAPYGRAAVTLLEHLGLLRRKDVPLPRPGQALPPPLLGGDPLGKAHRGSGGLLGRHALAPREAPLRLRLRGEHLPDGPARPRRHPGGPPRPLPGGPRKPLRGGSVLARPLGSHLPLEQDYLVLKGRGRPEVLAFHAYVGSPEARAVFRRYGFLLPGE